MEFQSLVERKLNPVGRSGEDIIYRCPVCEGEIGSGHLYVNYRKGYFHCFKCDLAGKRINKLLRILHIDTNYSYIDLYCERDVELDKILTLGDTQESSETLVDYSTDLEVLTAYYLHHVVPLSQRAYDYLLGRGLTPYVIERLCICEGISRFGEDIVIKGKSIQGRDYSGRIMVPSLRRDGLISFYVARDYIGGKAAKYLNPPKELVASSEDIWNLDMVASDSVIICEGVFTAISASPVKLNAVATYGKSIAVRSSNDTSVRVTSQGEKLLAKNFKNYYIAYDADAHTEALKSCAYLYDRGANVFLVTIDPKIYGPKADIADIGYEEFLELMKNATPYKGGLSDIL